MACLSRRTVIATLRTIARSRGGAHLFDELGHVLDPDGVTVPAALAELDALGLVDGEGLPGPSGANGFVLRGLTPAATALLRQAGMDASVSA